MHLHPRHWNHLLLTAVIHGHNLRHTHTSVELQSGGFSLVKICIWSAWKAQYLINSWICIGHVPESKVNFPVTILIQLNNSSDPFSRKNNEHWKYEYDNSTTKIIMDKQGICLKRDLSTSCINVYESLLGSFYFINTEHVHWNVAFSIWQDLHWHIITIHHLIYNKCHGWMSQALLQAETDVHHLWVKKARSNHAWGKRLRDNHPHLSSRLSHPRCSKQKQIYNLCQRCDFFYVLSIKVKPNHVNPGRMPHTCDLLTHAKTFNRLWFN